MKLILALLFACLITMSLSTQQHSVLLGHRGNVNSIAFSPDSKVMVSCDENGNLIFWDTESGATLHNLDTKSNITSVNYSPAAGNTVVFTDYNGYVTLMKADSKEIFKNFSLDGFCYYAVFSPDGTQLAVAYVKDPSEKEKDKGIRINYYIEIYETGKYTKTKTLKLTKANDDDGELFGSELFETYRFNYFNCDFNPAATYIAAGSMGKNIPIYSFEYKKFVPPYKGHSKRVFSVSFSPDGNYLASASKDETVKLWNVSSAGTILTLKGHSDDVNSSAFSPDSRYIATASDDETIKIWNVQTTRLLETLTGFGGDVIAVKFSPDGKYLAGGGENAKLLLWKTSDIIPQN
jgi:WD40 repeat protein